MRKCNLVQKYSAKIIHIYSCQINELQHRILFIYVSILHIYKSVHSYYINKLLR